MRPEAVLLIEESGAEFPQQPRPRGILYVLGSAALLAGGYLMGNLHASEGAFMRLGGLMGKDVIETVLTQDQFKSVFDAATAHMTPAELATTVFTVQDATTVAAPAFTPDVVHLQAWYKAAGRPAGDKTWAQHYMHDKLAAALEPRSAAPPPAHGAPLDAVLTRDQFKSVFDAATAHMTPAEFATTVFTVQDATTVAAPAFTPDVVHLQAWYKAAGRPAGDKTWAQHYMHDKLAAALEPRSAAPPPAHSAPLDAVLTRDQFKSVFEAATAHMTPAELATTVFTVQDATTVAAPAFTPDVVHLQAWYKAAGRPAGDKTWAQRYMHEKLAAGLVPHPVSPPAKNAPAATTACSTHIASYIQFGPCFSAATAGKTWSHILQVEKEVRTGVGAHGGNGVLHSFYASSAAPEKTLIDAMFDEMITAKTMHKVV